MERRMPGNRHVRCGGGEKAACACARLYLCLYPKGELFRDTAVWLRKDENHEDGGYLVRVEPFPLP